MSGFVTDVPGLFATKAESQTAAALEFLAADVGHARTVPIAAEHGVVRLGRRMISRSGLVSVCVGGLGIKVSEFHRLRAGVVG